MNWIKSLIGKLKRTGFFSIAGASIANKIMAFLCNIIIIRILSIEAYGSYSYALNICNYFLLFNGLGISSSVVQICVENSDNPENAEKIYKTAAALGIICDIILSILLLVFALFIKLPVSSSNAILILFLPLPLLTLLLDLQQQRLRSLFRNKEFARSTNIATALTIVGSIGGAVIASSIGLVVGRCLAVLASSIITRFRYQISSLFSPKDIKRPFVKDILTMSSTICVSNVLYQGLLLVGVTLIGWFIGEQKAVAAFSAASTIPFALLFIPGAVMIYLMPYLVKNARNRKWILEKWLISVAVIGSTCLIIALFSCLSANWLVPFIFGPDYDNSIQSFRLLIIGFVIVATFWSIPGNILGSHRKYSFNMFTNAVSLSVSIITSTVLIPKIGITGAAYGYIAAAITGSILSTVGLFRFAGNPAKPKFETR